MNNINIYLKPGHTKENIYDFYSDKNLSLKEIGLLSYLIWHTNHWKETFTIDKLALTIGDRNTSIRSTIKALIKNGYLECERLKEKNGQFSAVIYNIYL